MDGLTLAVIYSFAVGVLLATCLAFQLFDELRGDHTDRSGGGEVESFDHDGGE